MAPILYSPQKEVIPFASLAAMALKLTPYGVEYGINKVFYLFYEIN